MKGNDFENFFNNIYSIDYINRLVFTYPSSFVSPVRSIGVIAYGVQLPTDAEGQHLPVIPNTSITPFGGTGVHFSGEGIGDIGYWMTISIDFLSSWFLNKSLPIFLSKVSFGALLISMFLYWFQAMFQSNHTEIHFNKVKLIVRKVANLAMWLANITLVLMLFIRWIESGHFPLSNLYESLLFLSWSLTSIHLFFEKALNKENKFESTLTLGAITSPLSLFTNAFATFSLPHEMQKVTVLVPALQSNWLIMHVSVMIISYAALLSGSLLAMAFLVIQFIGTPKEKKRHLNSSIYTTTSESTLPKNSVHLSSLSSPSIPKILSPLPQCEAKEVMEGQQSSFEGTRLVRTLAKLQAIGFSKEGVDGISSTTLDSSFNFKELIPLKLESFFEDIAVRLFKVRRFDYSLENMKKKDSPAQLNFELFGATSQQIELAETLDNLSYRSIGLGFALLTVGILSGAVWANEAWGSYWSWDPKETWAFVTWLVFAFYLHTRLSKGWIGKESAFVATFGFVMVWFCYLGVNIFGKGLHSYGWMR